MKAKVTSTSSVVKLVPDLIWEHGGTLRVTAVTAKRSCLMN